MVRATGREAVTERSREEVNAAWDRLYVDVYEWDRPTEFVGGSEYASGGIRIITQRSREGDEVKGAVFRSHKATPEEVRWVLMMEMLKATHNMLVVAHGGDSRNPGFL